MLTYKIEISEYGLHVLNVGFTDCETIEIEINDFFKDKTNIETLYTHINEYVGSLPLHHQKEIYDTFYKVYSSDYKDNYTDPSVVVKLENKIAKVSELLNYNNFKLWIAQRESGIPIPENVYKNYTFDPDMNTMAEKTYVHREYVDLISLIIFIRALSPLYVEFYRYIKQITPHYLYKLFMLFIRSDIYMSPEIEKLKQYIQFNQQTLVPNSKNEHLVLSAGLSDDDISDSLVSEVIFNKLITIDFFNKKCNIVSFIFQTIKFKGSFINSNSVIIRSKSPVNETTKEDISYFEDYRKTSDIFLGTKVEIQHALSNLPNLLHGLGYTSFNVERFNEDMKDAHVIAERGIDKVQLYLLGWFLGKVINPRSLFYIENIKVIELLFFAKNVLLEEKQTFIAALLSSYKAKEANYVNIVFKNGLTKESIKKLSEKYKFVTEEDKQSPVEKTISELSREIVNALWVPVGTTDCYKNIIHSNGYIDIPNNINEVVAKYVESLHT